jgi:uncharacterized membrane-anchored protein
MVVHVSKFFKQPITAILHMQILRPIGMGVLSIIIVIGIIALVTELTEFEEIAKVVVIPSLVILISITGYVMLQTYNYKKLR